MSDELRVGIAVVLGGIILIAGWIRLYRPPFRTRKHKLIEAAKAKGNVVEGKLFKKRFIHGDRSSENEVTRNDAMKVTYEYQVDGISYYKKMTFQSIGMVCTQYPDTVMVYYDEKNPKRSACPEEATREMRQQAGCLAYFLVAVVVMALALNLPRLFF